MGYELAAKRNAIPEGVELENFLPSSVAWGDIIRMAEARGYLTKGKEEYYYANDGHYVSKRLAARLHRLTKEYLAQEREEPWGTLYEKRVVDLLIWLEEAKNYGFFIV